MNDGFGHEVPAQHAKREYRQVSRYLVVIASGGDRVARLFLGSREQVSEFDAGADAVADMIQGASHTVGAGGPEWDRALAGHSAQERANATVYELHV